MRALILLVTAAALCCTLTECQRPIPTAICLPQPVVQVPIQVQVRRAGKLDLCDLESGTSTATFSQFLLEEIVASFKSPTPVAKCRVQDLVETSCIAVGLRGQRVNVAYTANLTCSDGCQRYPGQQRDAQGAQKFFNGQVSTLRVAMRSKFSTKVKYEGRPVSIHYLSGSKGHVIEACQASYQGSIRDKMPLCECPQSCLDVCTLKPETGLCRAVIPRYFHNATSKQCELFTYGGCDGNQNNFVTQEDCATNCKVCPSGKVFQDCGTACPDTCDNKDEVRPCTLQCVQGCFCPSGMVEHGDECVTPEQCPTGATEEPTEPECPEGKVYQDCGTSCPKTCDNKDELTLCIFQCVEGCFCPSGMVEHGDECVTPEQCPTGATEEPTEPECPEGKVYQDCGTSCPKTCDNKDESSFCITQCVQGCFCPSGMVEHGDECVTPKQCPTGATEEPTEPECPEGKVYRDCGTACPKTCGNKDELTFCTLQCVQGCFCPFGMVEHGDECVTPENCPTGATEEPTEPQCPEGKVYQDCGTSCPKTCDNKDESSFCTLQCVQGCFCAFGMVEHGDECVTPEQCPTEATEEPTEPECPEGKVYQDCGTSCPKTCDNKNESSFCITLCVQGCFCPSGMVEHGDECVTPEKCPTEATEEPTEPECPEGKVYRDCGTACPKTCDNKDELTFCTLQCVQGCFCPSDTVELEDSCVPPSKCPDLCTLPPVTGICEAFIPSFFYNSTSRQCDMFVYGGCGGNGNRFESVKECKKACAPVDKCTLKPLAGACRARIPRYFYNSSSEQCETFNYGGCGGNDNRFESVKDCKKACDPDDCSSEPLTGPCKAFFTRFFFNTTSKQCEQFIYGGCQGNDNRYETEELCLETCGEDEDEDEHEDDSISKEKPTKPEPQCPEGKVYQDCGSSCPRTCDNKDELTICTDQCVQGCFCPEGEVLSGETCVDPNKCK